MAIPKRAEVPENLRWDLTRVFKSDQDWKDEYNKVKSAVQRLSNLKRNFTKSGKDLYDALTKILAVARHLEKVYTYASMASDVDTSDAHYLGYVSQVQSLASQFETNTSFINPGVLSISDEKLQQFKKDEPRLKNYDHWLEQITKKRPHTLPANEEKLIAGAP